MEQQIFWKDIQNKQKKIDLKSIFFYYKNYCKIHKVADVAQSVEQLIRNQ